MKPDIPDEQYDKIVKTIEKDFETGGIDSLKLDIKYLVEHFYNKGFLTGEKEGSRSMLNSFSGTIA